MYVKHGMFAYDQTVCGCGISVNVYEFLHHIHKHFKHLSIWRSMVWLGLSKRQLCRGYLRLFLQVFLLSNWSFPYN